MRARGFVFVSRILGAPTRRAQGDKKLFPLINGRASAVAILGCIFSLSSVHVVAEEKIAICHAGLITLPTFQRHVAELRTFKRVPSKRVDNLIVRNRKGGPNFFSSQIIVQEQQSGSGTFDLRLFHGFLNSTTKHRNATAWTCEHDDYPIAYFVGFRVREIRDGQIFVSREKDIVNVISLRNLDADLNKHTSVKVFQSERILCADIAVACDDGIFYERE
jgi:hypothetical protein